MRRRRGIFVGHHFSVPVQFLDRLGKHVDAPTLPASLDRSSLHPHPHRVGTAPEPTRRLPGQGQPARRRLDADALTLQHDCGRAFGDPLDEVVGEREAQLVTHLVAHFRARRPDLHAATSEQGDGAPASARTIRRVDGPRRSARATRPRRRGQRRTRPGGSSATGDPVRREARRLSTSRVQPILTGPPPVGATKYT